MHITRSVGLCEQLLKDNELTFRNEILELKVQKQVCLAARLCHHALLCGDSQALFSAIFPLPMLKVFES